MEKSDLPPRLQVVRSRVTRGRSLVTYISVSLASLLLLFYSIHTQISPLGDAYEPHHATTKHKPFEWSDIEPSTSFAFFPCYDGYECARLDVPLDWTASPSDQAEQRVAVAVVRLPARVSPTAPNYGGAILVNPGGPGGSGVHMAMDMGRNLQRILESGSISSSTDNDTGLLYDIVGFDPRGVNNTTPTPSCFPDDTTRQLWTVAREATGFLAENSTFPMVWSRNKALAQSCSKRLSTNWEGIGRYMNTPQVAADMVAIIEALGEWRERQGHDLVMTMRLAKHDVNERVFVETLNRTKWNRGQEKLLYIGFSYGTLLGTTFATLYPNRIHRMLLDGVVDAEDYYSGTWLSNLIDTDLIIGSFFQQCHAAGPTRCPLWSEQGVEGIRTRYHAILANLKDNPLPVPAHGKYAADVVTLSDAMNIVREAVYAPYSWFLLLASHFDDLSRGNGTALAAYKQDQASHASSLCRSTSCDKPYGRGCYAPTAETFREEMSAAVLCTDGPADQLQWEREDHFAKWHALRGQSRALGDFWAEITMWCANWSVRPQWNFSWVEAFEEAASAVPLSFSMASTLRDMDEGGDKVQRKARKRVRTSHPLLFASTTRDPVTPAKNARKMQDMFEGAGLVVLEDDGHCSLSAPSSCLAAVVERYFQDGEVPMGEEEEVRCEPDWWPFDDAQRVQRIMRDMADVKAEVVEGVKVMGERGYGRGRMPLGIL